MWSLGNALRFGESVECVHRYSARSFLSHLIGGRPKTPRVYEQGEKGEESVFSTGFALELLRGVITCAHGLSDARLFSRQLIIGPGQVTAV